MIRLKQRKRWLTTTLIVFWMFLPVSAGPINNTYQMCIDHSSAINPEQVWIPVGCDAPDCCPGCPASPIDWHIRLTGDAAESAVLKFENLPQNAAGNLVIEGNAHWLDGSSLWVGKGETILRGFVVDPQASEVPVAVPQINLNGQRVTDGATVEFKVEQFIGPVAVNESRLFYQFKPCPGSSDAEVAESDSVTLSSGLASDSITLSNNIGNDSAVILLDGRFSSGCLSDKLFRGNGDVILGNVLGSGTCRSEVAVFSDDNAMELIPNVTQWTDNPGNNLPVTLPPILQVPVTIWLARPGAMHQAQLDIANANELFNRNNVGVAFIAEYQDASAGSGGMPIGNDSDCITVIAIRNNPQFYQMGRLNVYYVNGAFTGVTCNQDPNVQFIGTTSLAQTLAHEFGHSFSLDHVGVPLFGTHNLMRPQVANRDDISVGQAFRMNVNCNSTLNRIVRTGPTRMCAPIKMNPLSCTLTPSPFCPPLEFNINPK